MERTYDEEIHKRINYLLCDMACMQMECSKDATGIERICSEKQWVSSQTVGESKQP